ncbi:hypothetical protein [Fibrella forsythiae]|uniref:IrrE N-terminal-like domain-containing protein n=1 Tax=Fibrella forsythiae TaxID=2817061 RepID=A0ABS3JC10_9BACT|nr:hypothetical protein [Fibrella forsythiae]MBO0946993.1 hypothetical protein [Fibrella forsythiae]
MDYAPGLTAVRFSDAPHLEAQTDPATGVCTVGMALWLATSDKERYFMLLHEAAHLELKTRDELICDSHALSVYRRRFPRDLMPTYTLLLKVLDPADPVHAARLQRFRNQF